MLRLLDIPHHEHHPEDLRQVIDGPLDEVADLALRGSSLGVGGYGHQRKWNDLGFAGGLRIKHPQVDHVPLSSQASKRLVEGNAGEPSRQTGVAAKLTEAAKSSDVGFLNHILGLAVVLDHRAGDAIEALVVALHDDAESVTVALARELNQLGIIESIQILRLCCIACLHRFVLSTTLGGEATRPGESAKIYRRQELLARFKAVAKHAEHAACHHGRRRLTDAAAGHASMRAFDDDGNALWRQHPVQRVGDLRRHLSWICSRRA